MNGIKATQQKMHSNGTITNNVITLILNASRTTALALSVAALATVCSFEKATATIIADVAGDWVASDGSTAGSVAGGTAAGWSYWRATAVNGGTENALTAYAQTGDVGGPGFGAGVDQNGGTLSNGRILPAIVGDNANVGDYELFGDGQINGAVVGTDILMHGDTVTADSNYVIARYTLSAADLLVGNQASIAGSFRNLVGGVNGIDAFVFHNATQLFTASSGGGNTLTQAAGTFNLNTVVSVGDTIDFVTWTRGDRGGDETALRATIALQPAPVPEPEALALALCGLLALPWVYRRRAARRRSATA